MTAKLRLGKAEIPFNLISLEQTTRTIVESSPHDWQIVTTPNLHHIHLIRRNQELARHYENSSMIVADGWPVAWLLSKNAGVPVERVAGSDLLEQILDSDGDGRPLVLVGGQDEDALGVVQKRAEQQRWKVTIEPAPAAEVGLSSSRIELLERIAARGSGGVVVLGLGAPKQEIFASELRSRPGSGFILCLGMAINFSAGRVGRAPEWMQRFNLEWIHRIISEPKRLGPRYVRDASAFIPTFIDNLGGRA